MISVSPIGRGLVAYLTQKAREDYFFAGGEAPGKWLFTAARPKLGLLSDVSAKDLRALTRGFSLQGEKLVKNAGRLEGNRKRHLGISLVFSAPKSWSVAWAFATPTDRKAMEDAFNRAIERTVREYIEPEIARCRLADGTQVAAQIVGALFIHVTSREGDMNYHGHLAIPSLGVCPDGQVRALVSKRFYDHKLDAGAHFRVALEYECRNLGMEFYRPLNARGEEKTHVEIKGVPRIVCRHFSKRRQQIEASLDAKGLASPAASDVATLQTRRGKDTVAPRHELFARWHEEALQHGLPLDWNHKTLSEPVHLYPDKEYHLALCKALEACLQNEAHFQRKDIFREVFVAAQGRGGADPKRLYTCLNRQLQNPGDFINLGIRNNVQRFTVHEVLLEEHYLLQDVDSLRAAKFAPLSERVVARSIMKPRTARPRDASSPLRKLYQATVRTKKMFNLDQEQQACVRYATQAPGRVKAICGDAGTSKTTVVAAIADAYRRAGYQTYGTALAGVAAKNLETTTGVKSDTLRMTLMRLYPTVGHKVKHHLKQLWRAARHRPTYHLDSLKLSRKSVLFVDEASMIGTGDFAVLAEACAKAKAVLILIGDAKQLPAIEHGGAFGSILQRCGGFELQTIRRQEREEERDRVKQLSRGEAEEVLKAYAREGRVHIENTHTDAQRQLVSDWSKNGGVQFPEKHAILACTNIEVRQLNDLAQQQRLKAGRLNRCSAVTIKDETFYKGDRVYFTKKSRKLRVENGDVGTIVAIRNNPLSAAVTVRLDGERQCREVPLRTLFKTHYSALTRGYASTVHRMQSKGVDHAYCLLTGAMTDREITYVSLSRHHKSVQIYTDQNHAGVELARLASEATGERRSLRAKPGLDERYSPLIIQATKSNAKTLATDQKQDVTLKITLGEER